MGEPITYWLVFYDQVPSQISHKTLDKEPYGHGPVLRAPSCCQGLPEGNVPGLICLFLHSASTFPVSKESRFPGKIWEGNEFLCCIRLPALASFIEFHLVISWTFKHDCKSHLIRDNKAEAQVAIQWWIRIHSPIQDLLFLPARPPILYQALGRCNR